jgi:2-dehydropantoate 2-reductase
MRILVIGAGAVGGYFGARLAQAGRDVTFLLRGKRLEQVRKDGLQIVSPFGDATVRVQALSAKEIDNPYDVIFLSVKSYALTGAMEDFAPAVGPQTMILPVLNGMQHMQALEKRFGAQPLLGGVAQIASELDAAGRVVQLSPMQTVTYGERDKQTTPRITRLDETMRNAGFEAKLSTDIMNDMWRKWIQLATLGAMNSLLDGSVGEIVSAPGGREVAIAILHESAAVSKASGFPQPEEFLAKLTGILADKDSKLTSSMYRDMKSGAPVEADTILGDLLHYAQKGAIDTPLLRAAYVRLSIYQANREKTAKSAAR